MFIMQASRTALGAACGVRNGESYKCFLLKLQNL